MVPEKYLHDLVVFVTSIEGTPALLRGRGHLFWVSKRWFNLHSADTLAIKKRLTTKFVDKFKFSLVTIATAFKT